MSRQEAVKQTASIVTPRSKQTTKLAIVALLGNPALTHEQIARMVGKSKRTVARISQELRRTVGDGSQQVEEYRRVIASQLPMHHRATRLAQLVNQKKQAKVALDALIRADQLLGIHTAVELRQRDPEPEAVPRIVMPPGTNVRLTRTTTVEITSDDQSCAREAQTIEATRVTE